MRAQLPATAALAAAALLATPAAAQAPERATGQITIERAERDRREAAPAPGGVVLERDGRPVAAPDRATGPVTIEREERRPARDTMVIESEGRRVEMPRGEVEIRGAHVEIVEEERRTRLTMRNDVLFAFDRAELRPEAELSLQRVARLIAERRPSRVRVVGHTDSVGNDAYNQRLSEQRALSVARWLEGQGRGMPQIVAEGRGEREPVAESASADGRDNPDGRQRNRCVDVLLER